jgi:hypothetical protein
MHQEEFRCFYQFVFFICREQGKRNVQVGAGAVQVAHVLTGRAGMVQDSCPQRS